MGARKSIVDNYFSIIKNFSSDAKLELISKLSDSLRNTLPGSAKEDNSWKKLYGAFESDQSAEEIIKDLRNSRYTNRMIEEI